MTSKKLKKKLLKNQSIEMFNINSKEFTRENLIESIFIRPFIQMLSFATFIIAMFLLVIENYEWGGSLIIFSFILNMSSIYKSLCDEPSIYRTLNLTFKLVLFTAEVIAFSYLISIIRI
jgi:hypothetical protein